MPTFPFSKCVVPIYQAPDGELDHVGSGVLLETSTSRWLISAAHNFALADKIPFILPGPPDALTPLNGDLLMPSSEVRDSLDVAVVRLGPKEIAGVEGGGFAFLPAHPETVSVEGEQVDGGLGFAVGFPARDLTIDHTQRRIKFTVNEIMAPFYPHDTLRRFGFDPSTHLGLQYRKFQNNEGQKMTPKPQGMSGGGVWLWRNNRARLVGILTEYHKARGLVLCVRLTEVLFGMREAYGNC